MHIWGNPISEPAGLYLEQNIRGEYYILEGLCLTVFLLLSSIFHGIVYTELLVCYLNVLKNSFGMSIPMTSYRWKVN